MKIDESLCINCGICYNNCEHHGLNEVKQNNKVYYIQNTNCIGCRECLKACPANAIRDDKMIYISGAITGTDDYIERFKNAEDSLIKKYGMECLNPVRVCARHYAYPNKEKWETLMLLLLAYISESCTHIYMLPGWEKSYGAKIEKLWAEKLGLIFIESL